MNESTILETRRPPHLLQNQGEGERELRRNPISGQVDGVKDELRAKFPGKNPLFHFPGVGSIVVEELC